jgi:nitrite reductase/ring-hydroxylating ferredoxin subunit
MLKKIGIGLSALTLALIATACASSSAVPQANGTQQTTGTQPSASTPSPAPETIQATSEKPSGSIQAKLIDAQVNGDSVSIPVSDVESDWNTQFVVNSQSGKMNFMAYLLKNKIYVRADVCPPCRSIGYSLDGNTLVCDRCATTFKADTGDGIAGACVDYPKALVPYQISNGNIVMKQADLVLAYESTLNPGWP